MLPSGTLSQTPDFENLVRERLPSPSATKTSDNCQSVVDNIGDGGRGQVASTVADDRHLLSTLGVRLCVQRDGRLDVTLVVARVCRRQLILVGGSRGVSRVLSCVCGCVCVCLSDCPSVCLCPCPRRETAPIVNNKVDRHQRFSRKALVTEIKRSKVNDRQTYRTDRLLYLATAVPQGVLCSAMAEFAFSGRPRGAA